MWSFSSFTALLAGAVGRPSSFGPLRPRGRARRARAARRDRARGRARPRARRAPSGRQAGDAAGRLHHVVRCRPAADGDRPAPRRARARLGARAAPRSAQRVERIGARRPRASQHHAHPLRGARGPWAHGGSRSARGTRRLASWPAGIGGPGTPTPVGRFAIQDPVPTLPEWRGVYGAHTLTLTAHSPTLRRFMGGDALVAIHGAGSGRVLAGRHALELRLRDPLRARPRGAARHARAGTPVIIDRS